MIKHRRKLSKYISRALLIILGLIVISLVFVFLSPDYDIYTVQGESMKPDINRGDIVVIGPVDGWLTGKLEAGKIITYEYEQSTITHRIDIIDGNTIITKGDAVEDPDPWPVSLSQVKGIAFFKLPYAGHLISFAHTKLGWFLAIIIPAMLLVCLIGKDITQEVFRNNKRKTDKKGV